MSLTSYRAAPPRETETALETQKAATPTGICGPCSPKAGRRIVMRYRKLAICRPGSDLLSRALRQSTMGAGAFHGRVRNGIGCSHPAITTRSAKCKLNNFKKLVSCAMPHLTMGTSNENNQVNRAISTGKLHALPHLHTRPINVVVFHGSQGNTSFEVGFPLRCLQRLSRPYIATLLCRWHDNRSTRDTSIPVLSY